MDSSSSEIAPPRRGRILHHGCRWADTARQAANSHHHPPYIYSATSHTPTLRRLTKQTHEGNAALLVYLQAVCLLLPV